MAGDSATHPLTPPLPPTPQVRLQAGICLDRLRLGVVDEVMAVGSGCCLQATPPPLSPEYGLEERESLPTGGL